MQHEVQEGKADDVGYDVSDAFTAVRGLLQCAEADAAEVRRDADRYLARREQEAELLVAKARRVLTAAEDKAAALLARAREQAVGMLAAAEAAGRTADLADARAVVEASSTPEEPVTVIDLVAAEVPVWKSDGLKPTDSGLDRILASAISNAVQRAFPSDR